MRRLLTTLVVLLVLLGLADRGALLAAQALLARRAQASAGLLHPPAVHVRGFPFLTQVARGRYDEVDVDARDLVRGSARVSTLAVRLQDVRLPLSDLLHAQVAAVAVGRVVGTAVLPYASLSGAARQVSDAGGGLVRVRGTVDVLGQSLSAAAVSRVRVEGGALVVQAVRLEVGNAVADSVLSTALGGRLDLRIALPALPYGLQVTGLSVQPDGVQLSATGSSLVLHS